MVYSSLLFDLGAVQEKNTAAKKSGKRKYFIVIFLKLKTQ
jgi:hypothetical protein